MLKTITFQIGTDMIGQPMYHTHYVSEIDHKVGTSVIVLSETHR